MGRDDETLRRIGLLVELHVEQGKALVDLGRPVAVASAIDAHGRWRLRFAGQGNHAGTTTMADRRDPMVAAARFVLAAQEIARAHPHVRATVGRLVPNPGGTNVIASSATAWLDVRAGEDGETRDAVDEMLQRAQECAAAEACTLTTAEESWGGRVAFDPLLAKRFSQVLDDAPLLPTGAGHDAGVLAAAGVPTAMLFVRNPTGISHAPEEHADDADCERGVEALAACLREALS
jgi:N-carbamoyl-L-amino-acid hydrolase